MDLHLDQDYTFNPDGSGKVLLRWEGDAPGPDLEAGAFMASEVANGKGVEAWSAMSCEIVDGKLKFHATAYFKDPAALRFHCHGFHSNSFDFTVSTDDSGNLVVKNPAPAPVATDGASATDEQLRARLGEERAKFGMARDFMAGMMGGLVCTATLHLPGTVGSLKHGKKSGKNAVTTRFEGKAIVDLLDRLMVDDELALKLLRIGKEGPEVLLGFLGDLGPLEVTAKGPLAPLFDFEAEAAEGRQAFAALSETLNLPKGPETGPPMENVRIVAAKVVREADSDREFTPMNQNYASISFAVAGDLPEGVLKVEEGRMDAAVPDAGGNLVPDDDWKRRIHFPKITKDRRTAYFDVEFPLPDGGADGFSEIRGTLDVQVSSGMEDVDLGFKKLETGAAGSECGAVIERLEVQDEERATLELKLQISMERLQSLSLAAPKKEPVALYQNGYSSSGEECTLTYTIEGAIPRKAKLVARMATNLHRVTLPFVVRDVDALGRSRKG